MVKATWLGHAAWEFAGEKKVVIVDPFLDENPKASKRAADVKRADVVLTSHDHFDHFADAPAICKATGATLVATYEVASAAAEEHKIKVEGMNIGGSVDLGGVVVHMTIAFHTSGRGHPTGWVIEMDGARIYHTGDTCLFGDMRLLGEIFRPDLMCVPIGDRFTMGPPSAARAVELVRPRVAIPMHYDTWPPIAQDPAKWRALVAERSRDTKVVILKPGETHEVQGG